MDFKLINVGIGEIGISGSPDVLRTILGSCVGICLYDPAMKIGGISHIMLPSIKNKTSSKNKYADTAIPVFITELEKRGVKRRDIVAKIVGGATMFTFSRYSIMAEIGRNNVDKVREVLREYRIEILSEDVGGDYGRTLDFYLENGLVKIKSLGKAIKTM